MESERERADHIAKMLRTGGALLTVQGMTWLTSLVGILVVPRFLGSSQFGAATTIWTVAAFATLFASWGTTNQAVIQAAREPTETRNFVFHIVALRLLLWSPIFAVILSFGLFSQDDLTIRAMLLIVSCGATVALVTEPMLAALQGAHSLGRAASASAIVGVFAQLATLLVLVMGGGLVAISLVGVVGAVVVAVAIGALFFKRMTGNARPSRRLVRSILTGGSSFLAWDLGLRIYGTADFLILASLTSARDVGEYAFAYRLVGIPVFATTIVTMSIFPSLAAANDHDARWFSHIVNESLRIVVLVALPTAVGLSVLAPGIVELFGGSKFHGSPILLAILAAQIPLVAVGTVLGTAMFACGRQRYMANLAWIAAGLNIGLNLALIPLFESRVGSGAVACALVTLATELFVAIAICRAARSYLKRSVIAPAVVRGVAAAGVMGLAVAVLHPFVFTLGLVLIGAFVYLLAAVALKAVSFHEMRSVGSALRPRRMIHEHAS